MIKCPHCGASFGRSRKNWIFKVRLTMGSRKKIWTTSIPVTKVKAEHEMHELRARGYEVRIEEIVEKLEADE